MKIYKKLYLFIALFLLTIFFSFSAYAARLTIVYTNSLNGYFDDCHCKEDPKGGLVTRATEIENIRKTFSNILLFETGDIFTCEPDKILAKYLLKAYKHIGYDLLVFGDQEFSAGIEEFLTHSNILPFVCNNIMLKVNGKWEKKFDRYKLLHKNNIKIGVIGSISPDSFKYYPQTITDNIKISDQIKEIEADIKELKNQKSDIIILLSHSGYDTDAELSKKIKGINLIIGGHSQTMLKMPSKVENTFIVQAGANGANIGILEIDVKGNEITVVKNSFRLPHLPATKEDKAIRKMINEYLDEAKKEYEKVRFK